MTDAPKYIAAVRTQLGDWYVVRVPANGHVAVDDDGVASTVYKPYYEDILRPGNWLKAQLLRGGESTALDFVDDIGKLGPEFMQYEPDRIVASASIVEVLDPVKLGGDDG